MTDKLIFFGTSDFSAPALEALIKAGFNLVAVITKPDMPAGRGQKIIEPAVKKIAKKHAIKTFQPLKFKDIREELAALKPDAGVVVAYGKIIPQSVIDLFPKGLINTHASLLPKYRGPAPIEAAIKAGDKESGITLMQIDAGMDTGPAYVMETINIENSNRLDLYQQLSQLGADMLVKHLPDILSSNLKPKSQDHDQATVVSMISKADAPIDWLKPAEEIERVVRAHLGWPGSTAEIAGVDVVITEAHVSEGNGEAGQAFKTEDNQLGVYCGRGALLIDKLKPAGKPEMTGRAFLAGHKL